MNLISVIVPVYNIEMYISRCIESVLSQTYTNWELILIDDGSLDKSGLICDDYQKKDRRIIVIHKQNGGVSSARNAGLSVASGNYVVFMDSDDWADSTYLQHLIEGVENEGCGIVVQGHHRDTPEGSFDYVQSSGFYKNTDFDQLPDTRNLCFMGIPWGALYNNSLIKDNNLHFEESIHFAEDFIFLMNYLLHADWAKFINTIDYHYTIVNANSLVNRSHSFESELKGYRYFRDVVVKYKTKFYVEDRDLTITYSRMAELAFRGIKTMYRKGKYQLPRSLRILNARKAFDTFDISLLRICYPNMKVMDKIIFSLLSNQHYKLLDLILTCFTLKEIIKGK